MGALRSAALQGGLYLTGRQVTGLVIGAAGAFALAFEIGPAAFGIYAAGSAVYVYLASICHLGVSTFLIRSENIDDRTTHVAFTLLLAVGIVGAICAIPLVELAARWNGLPGFRSVGLVLCASLPLELLGTVPMALLERDLKYRQVASVELAGQIGLYLVALPLALLGPGAWAAVAGWWCHHLVRLAGSFLLCSYRPRPAWDRAILNTLLSYGFGHAASSWVWSLRALVNPLIVGRYLGAEAVGVIALTIRLVESLPVFKGTIWRISIAAMGKFQRDSLRVSAAVQEGMRLQVFSVGLPLCGFAVVGPMIIPTDSAWHPILLIFPYIAVGTLVNSTLSSLSAALYVLGRNWDVAAFYLVHVIVFAATATVLVPRIGLSGYGVAELAALPTYVLLHRSFGRQLGVSAYGTVAFWSLGFALTLFTPLLGPWALLGIFVIMLAPVTWHFVTSQFAALWSVSKERGG